MAATKGTSVKTVRNYSLPPLQLQYYQALSSGIYNVNIGLAKLAELGRPGLWVLHNEDLYQPELDTRPGSRNPDEVISIKEIEYHGVPLQRARTLHWSGSGPTPDFLSIDFWKDAIKRLDEQSALAEARSIQPQFTPSELQVLEELESQPNHDFHRLQNEQQARMSRSKNRTFKLLFKLAQLGRPGRWILHQEELFHPVIDTRPETRNATTANNVKHVVIRDDSIFLGVEVEVCEGVFADFELHWSGTGAQPDFGDFLFWQRKEDDLSVKKTDVEAGRITPGFLPEELRRLEAMENDRSHAFAVMPLLVPKPQTPELTPEEDARLTAFVQLKYDVVESLMNLWNAGLAGKWVLHNEDLFLPEHDIVNRAQPGDNDSQGSGGINITNLIVEKSTGLRFDIRRAHSLPDFDDPEYWRQRDADLRKKIEDIEAGRRTGHNFTKADLLRIALLERALEKSYGMRENQVVGSGSNPAADGGVLAWLNNGAGDADDVPEPEDLGTPLQSPGAAQERNAPSPDIDRLPSASTKRKRGSRNTEHDHEPARRSTQRTKVRLEAKKKSLPATKKSPPAKQSTRRASRKPASPSPVPPKTTPETKVAAAKAARSGETRKDGSPVRRSARIRALALKNNLLL